MTIIYNEHYCANNNRKGICNTISTETNTFGTSMLPVPTTCLCPCFAQRYLPAIIKNNLLFLKPSTDNIITKVTDSTHVNFSQLERFVCTLINFYV